MPQHPSTYNPQWQIPSAFAQAALGEAPAKRTRSGGPNASFRAESFEHLVAEAERKGGELGISAGEYLAYLAEKEPTDINMETAARFYLQGRNPELADDQILSIIGHPKDTAEESADLSPEEEKAFRDATDEFQAIGEQMVRELDGEDYETWRNQTEGIEKEFGPFGTTCKRDYSLEGEGATSKGAADFEGGPARVIMQSGRIFDADDVREDGEFYTLDFGDGNEMSVPKTKVESIKFGEQKRIEALETAPRPRGR